MILLLIGLGVLVGTVIVFVTLLPRGGKTHRLVNTEWEPYVGVALTAAVALGCTMSLSGVLALVGSPA
jgi:hypothetical protein